MSSWYYAEGNDRKGPCEEHELENLVRSGTIRGDTLVWAQGMADWKPAREVSALNHHFSAPAAPAPPPPAAPNPYAAPPGPGLAAPGGHQAPVGAGSGPVYHTPPAIYQDQMRSLDSLTTWYFVCLYAGIPLCFLFIGFPMLIAAIVLHFVLLYRFWSVIQDAAPGEVRTTPGKAVGFMFIPLFNLYWVFQAYPGLATDMHHYAGRRGFHVSNEEGIGLAGAIFTIIGAGLSYLIFWPILFSRMKTNAKQILHWKMTQGGSGVPQPASPYAPY